ncbi:MAG TPA: hypothetical protein VJZ24_01955 [Thermodesulfovibrionales bacterium]|nr:hypothetical protein [Thermodesulfovibrionales bacterium]
MILLDNTVLSNFALVKQMALLKEYCGDKAASINNVFDEFKQGVKERIFADTEFDWIRGLDLSEKENTMFLNFCKKLGKGEASCLAIAISRGHDLLSDDMAVRKIALREGVRFSGSIGVLLELTRMGRIGLEKGNEILNGFIKCGYYSPVNKLDGLTLPLSS